MTSQSCAECGTRAEPGQSFCDACGAVLSWSDREERAERTASARGAGAAEPVSVPAGEPALAAGAREEPGPPAGRRAAPTLPLPAGTRSPARAPAAPWCRAPPWPGWTNTSRRLRPLPNHRRPPSPQQPRTPTPTPCPSPRYPRGEQHHGPRSRPHAGRQRGPRQVPPRTGLRPRTPDRPGAVRRTGAARPPGRRPPAGPDPGPGTRRTGRPSVPLVRHPEHARPALLRTLRHATVRPQPRRARPTAVVAPSAEPGGR